MLNIPETIEEAQHMLGKDWMHDAAMAFHYRHTLPNLRAEYVRKLKQKTGKVQFLDETDAMFVKRVLNL